MVAPDESHFENTVQESCSVLLTLLACVLYKKIGRVLAASSSRHSIKLKLSQAVSGLLGGFAWNLFPLHRSFGLGHAGYFYPGRLGFVKAPNYI